MKLEVLGFIIFFVGLLISYVGWIAYVTFWYLIGNKVEEDFSFVTRCTYEDGTEGYTHVYCFKPTRWNQWIFNMYCKKFGA